LTRTTPPGGGSTSNGEEWVHFHGEATGEAPQAAEAKLRRPRTERRSGNGPTTERRLPRAARHGSGGERRYQANIQPISFSSWRARFVV
jgi:hypothetical protein